jgi:hypothetical protein
MRYAARDASGRKKTYATEERKWIENGPEKRRCSGREKCAGESRLRRVRAFPRHRAEMVVRRIKSFERKVQSLS